MAKPPLASILIIEDDGDLLEVLSYVLEDAGYRIFAASNSADGLELAETESIDLVILDISMTGMNGIDVGRALRSDSRTANVLIAVHTGLPEEEVRMEFAEFDLFMPKIDDADVLLGKVVAALGSRASAPSAYAQRAESKVVPP